MTKKPEEMTDQELDIALAAEAGSTEIEKPAEDMTDEELDQALGAADQNFKKEQQEALQLSPLETAAASHVDTLSMNYGPQIQAGLDKLMDPETNYANRRDAYRALLDESPHEMSKMAGMGTGMASQMLLNPIGRGAAALTKASTPMAKGAAQAVGNVASMALSNPGDTPGEVVPFSEKNLDAINPIEHYVTVPLAALPGLAPIMNMTKVPERMANKAFAPTGREMEKSLKAGAKSADKAENLGGYALENDLIRPFSGAEEIYRRTARKVDEVGKKIGEFAKKSSGKVEEWVGMNPDDAADFSKNRFNQTASKQNVLNLLDDEIGDNREAIEAANDFAEKEFAHFAKRYGDEPDLADLQKMRTSIQKNINYNRKSGAKEPFKEAAYKAMLTEVDRSMDSMLDVMEKAGGSKELRALRSEYSLLKKLEERASRQAGKDLAAPSQISSPLTDPIKPGARTYSAAASLMKKPNPAMMSAPFFGSQLGAPPPPVPLNEDDVRMMDIPPSQRAKMISDIRKGKPVYPN